MSGSYFVSDWGRQPFVPSVRSRLPALCQLPPSPYRLWSPALLSVTYSRLPAPNISKHSTSAQAVSFHGT